MKKTVVFTLFIASVLVFGFTNLFNGENPKTIEIGQMAPGLETKLELLDGSTKMLREFGKQNGTLVIFSCNTCPFVVAWENRYNEIYSFCEQNNIGMVLVNSNEAKRKNDDSPEEMKKHAKELGYKAPYVIDNKSTLANHFGAATTPHVFLFNNQFNLVYKGAIDDNSKNRDAVTQPYLMNALNQLLKGEKISTPQTKAVGCSIKRV